MKDLIARLEAATEGSRELDEAIAHLVGTYQAPDRGDPYGTWPHYTTSLDMAMTLVPAGLWGGKIMWNGSERGRGGYVELDLGPVSPAGAYVALVSSYEDQDDRDEIPAPRPLPLAMCIAALKARSANG